MSKKDYQWYLASGNLPASYFDKKKKKGGAKKAPSGRHAIVSKVMREHGMSLPAASKYVKEHGLY
jgi:hypothetical protein